jgi:hypothetical protein
MEDKVKLKSWEERGHRTFWWHLKKIYNIDRPTKYCVIFNTYTDSPKSFSVTPFDTIDEALEEAKLINIMYSDTPKPQKIYVEKGGKYQGKRWYHNSYNLDYSNGAYFWGYMVLDMINNKIIKIVNNIKHCGFTFDSKITLDTLDVLFRGEDEIPEDYIWDKRGEYNGWLQFRWGDKKNALDYVEPPKKERPGVDEYFNVWDEAKETYVRKKLRVVYVDWNDELPKPEKGITYLRPNKEPVIFPGEYGYEGDYSLQEWSLSEEVAGNEYLDNGGTFKPEETKNSLADMLGDDNPLMKLKKQLEND